LKFEQKGKQEMALGFGRSAKQVERFFVECGEIDEVKPNAQETESWNSGFSDL